LVDQNTTLKKDLAVAERKLAARTDRIRELEASHSELQHRLELQNEQFEQQTAKLMEKLNESRGNLIIILSFSFLYLDSLDIDYSFFNFTGSASNWTHSAKIAKPLRGGGGGSDTLNNRSSGINRSDKSASESWYVKMLNG